MQGTRRTRTQDLAVGVTTEERMVIQWYAEVQGIPVRQLLRRHSVTALLDRALAVAAVADVVVPLDVARAARRLHSNAVV